MKIVCDKCQTKYSIADDKVSGKVFKIRCKKCSHIIVVKGGENASRGPMSMSASVTIPPADVTPATDADKVWFLVVGGEQVGPYARAEVKSRHAAGEIDGETYAWREGFGDWLKLASIDDFRDLLADGGGAAAPAQLLPPAADVFAPQATQPDAQPAPVQDIFAAAALPAPTPAPAPVSLAARAAAAAAAPAPAPADDLFGAVATAGGASTPAPLAALAAAASAEREPVRARVSAMASGPTANGSDVAAHDSKLTGQRNENSVLFSLSNLSAMATAGGAKASAAPEARGGGFTAPRTEGSGLIDIRAMAAATLAGSAPSSDNAVDIPSFSAAPVFSPMVAAPVMMPSPPSGMPRWALALVGVIAVGILGIGGLLYKILNRPDPTPAVVTLPLPAPPPVPAPAVAPAPAAPVVAAAVGAAAATTRPGEAKPPVGEAKPVVAAADAHKSKKPLVADTHRGARGPAAAADSTPPPPPAPARSAKRKGGGGGDTLDDLLNDAAPGRRPPAPARAPIAEAAPPADDPSLPEQLDRGDVLAGMRAVQPKVMTCFAQYHVPGTAMVSLTIAKTGRVSAANVGGALEGTPTGDCVAKMVKGASFKRFKGSAMPIQYPFILR